jgi:hypothetical protein
MLLSGLLHGANPYQFLQSVAAYDLIPFEAAVLVATFLPLLQLTIGLMLLTETWSSTALLMAVLLLIIYWLAGVLALTRGLAISCGCFGVLSPRITWTHSALMLLLTSAVLFGFRRAVRFESGESTGDVHEKPVFSRQ